METAHDPACDGRHPARQRCNDALTSSDGERRFRLPWRSAVQDGDRGQDDTAYDHAPPEADGPGVDLAGVSTVAPVDPAPTAAPPSDLVRDAPAPPAQPPPDLLRDAVAAAPPPAPTAYVARAWRSTAAAVEAPDRPAPAAAAPRASAAPGGARASEQPPLPAARIALVVVVALIALLVWSLSRPRRAEAPAHG